MANEFSSYIVKGTLINYLRSISVLELEKYAKKTEIAPSSLNILEAAEYLSDLKFNVLIIKDKGYRIFDCFSLTNAISLFYTNCLPFLSDDISNIRDSIVFKKKEAEFLNNPIVKKTLSTLLIENFSEEIVVLPRFTSVLSCAYSLVQPKNRYCFVKTENSAGFVVDVSSILKYIRKEHSTLEAALMTSLDEASLIQPSFISLPTSSCLGEFALAHFLNEEKPICVTEENENFLGTFFCPSMAKIASSHTKSFFSLLRKLKTPFKNFNKKDIQFSASSNLDDLILSSDSTIKTALKVLAKKESTAVVIFEESDEIAGVVCIKNILSFMINYPYGDMVFKHSANHLWQEIGRLTKLVEEKIPNAALFSIPAFNSLEFSPELEAYLRSQSLLKNVSVVFFGPSRDEKVGHPALFSLSINKLNHYLSKEIYGSEVDNDRRLSLSLSDKADSGDSYLLFNKAIEKAAVVLDPSNIPESSNLKEVIKVLVSRKYGSDLVLLKRNGLVYYSRPGKLLETLYSNPKDGKITIPRENIQIEYLVKLNEKYIVDSEIDCTYILKKFKFHKVSELRLSSTNKVIPVSSVFSLLMKVLTDKKEGKPPEPLSVSKLTSSLTVINNTEYLVEKLDMNFILRSLLEERTIHLETKVIYNRLQTIGPQSETSSGFRELKGSGIASPKREKLDATPKERPESQPHPEETSSVVVAENTHTYSFDIPFEVPENVESLQSASPLVWVLLSDRDPLPISAMDVLSFLFVKIETLLNKIIIIKNKFSNKSEERMERIRNSLSCSEVSTQKEEGSQNSLISFDFLKYLTMEELFPFLVFIKNIKWFSFEKGRCLFNEIKKDLYLKLSMENIFKHKNIPLKPTRYIMFSSIAESPARCTWSWLLFEALLDTLTEEEQILLSQIDLNKIVNFVGDRDFMSIKPTNSFYRLLRKTCAIGSSGKLPILSSEKKLYSLTGISGLVMTLPILADVSEVAVGRGIENHFHRYPRLNINQHSSSASIERADSMSEGQGAHDIPLQPQKLKGVKNLFGKVESTDERLLQFALEKNSENFIVFEGKTDLLRVLQETYYSRAEVIFLISSQRKVFSLIKPKKLVKFIFGLKFKE